MMPCYYLHLKCDGELIEDTEGFNLPDVEAARAEALGGMRDILADNIKSVTEPVTDTILVMDEAGQELASVSLNDALPAKLRRTAEMSP